MAFGEPTFEMDSERLNPHLEEQETEKESAGNTYDRYRAMGGGTLSEKQYEEVLRRAIEAAALNPQAANQALGYAKVAGIASLTPETIAYYAALRYQPDEQRADYGKLADQELLAEALRMKGDAQSLQAFIKWNHIIFPPASPTKSV